MAYKMEVFSALCSMRVFDVNGIAADTDDFGEQFDHDPMNAPDYGCADMRFGRFMEPPEGVLEKYGITLSEFEEIGDELSDLLSFGSCGWCV
jgi:hypothetical protein